MTAAYRAFPATLDDIDPVRLLAALPNLDEPGLHEQDFEYRQSRAGEENRGRSLGEELRAIYCSPTFWKLADLLPHNTLASLRPGFGRPRDYPDWLLLLVCFSANLHGTRSRGAVVHHLRDKRNWTNFVHDVDRFVPEGWAQLRQLEHAAGKQARRERRGVHAKLSRHSNIVPLAPLRQTSYARSASIAIASPAGHHLDYFVAAWRGYRRTASGWVPRAESDPWFGVREAMLDLLPTLATQQAQDMGLLDPEQPFQFQKPDRAQAIAVDGTVFTIGKYKTADAAVGVETHDTCGGTKKATGSKFTITSTRVPGQPLSRIMLDFGHTGHAEDSRYATEAEGMEQMAYRIRDLTKGGARLLIPDSACRGATVVRLQQGGLTVVNYPHALYNPNRNTGKRLAPGRIEKSHLRTTARHEDTNGNTCEHAIYAIGGLLVERVTDAEGADTIRALEVSKYEQRWQREFATTGEAKIGKRREYLTVHIECGLAGDFDQRVALFHTDGPSDDPDYNWGEVIRVFSPGTRTFAYLYGARNDTEARHNDIKSRICYMPADIRGQELRLLGCAVVINSVSWQTHLHAHGLPNVFDDTV